MRSLRVRYALPFFTKVVFTCPVCGGSSEFEYRNRYTRLDRCTECGHVYARKQPRAAILNLMYNGFQYWLQDKVHKGITEIKYGPEWDGFLKARMDILQDTGVLSHDSKYKVFEVGCSEGMLLRELTRHGHEASGCEMNRCIAEQGKKELNVDIVALPFEKMSVPQDTYDLVVSFHTLEHLRDVVDAFTKVAHMLKPKGSVLVEVPSGKEEYETTDHLHFFSEESLRRLVDRFFEETRIVHNSYENAQGVTIGSLYAIGRHPRS